MREDLLKSQAQKAKGIAHKKNQINTIINKTKLKRNPQSAPIPTNKIAYQIREISKKIKKISVENYWGELIDSLAHNALIPLLQEQNIFLHKAWTHCKDRGTNNLWEIDILAHSDIEIVALNLYPFLEMKDVDNFIKTIKKFKKCSLLSSGKTLYGAVAYIKTFKKVATYAENRGLFVIGVPV